jgi:hypothetical protein
MSIVMLSPIPYKSFSVTSGSVYVADQYGIIAAVATTADQLDLSAAGCATLSPQPTDLLGKLVGADFNVTTDQVIPINNSIRYRIRRISVLGASLSLTTAVGGFYTGAAKTGLVLVANTQTYSALTAANLAEDMTLALPNNVIPAATPLYLSLTTAQGAAATADVYVYGDVLA